MAAAHSLVGGIVDAKQPGAAVLPPVAKLPQFSQKIAQAVAQVAVAQDLNQKPIPDVQAAVKSWRWTPEYEWDNWNKRDEYNAHTFKKRFDDEKIQDLLKSNGGTGQKKK